MKPISNVKEHIFLLLDLINLLQRDARDDTQNQGIDLELPQKLITRLDSGKNNNLVGENSIVKDDLIKYVTKLMTTIGSRTISSKSIALEVTEILTDNFDKELVKATLLEENSKLKEELRYKINDFVTREEVVSTLKSTLYEINNATNIKLNTILDNTMSKLESMYSKSEDNEHVTMEISSDDVSVEKLEELGKKADEALNKKVYKLGFQDFNRMLQGGLRAGQFTTFAALPSNFKTGMAIRCFQDIATLNKPTIWDDGKKSALVWFSFEDPLGTTIKQMYMSLYMDEHGVSPDMKELNNGEIFKAVLDKLKANGWHVIFKKINGNDWTYRSLFKELEDIEKDGYRIEALTLDYLPHLSTSGCTNNNGAIGSALRELVRRVAHYCTNKDILLMTPLQLSPGAKKLLQMGVEDYEFVRKLPGKGYYEGASALDTEIFLELFSHIAKIDGKAYLCLQRGKHKIPSFIDEEDKFVMIPLPRRGYSKSDLNDTKPCGFKRVEDISTESDGVFSF